MNALNYLKYNKYDESEECAVKYQQWNDRPNAWSVVANRICENADRRQYDIGTEMYCRKQRRIGCRDCPVILGVFYVKSEIQAGNNDAK
jgi:hypothetical protein